MYQQRGAAAVWKGVRHFAGARRMRFPAKVTREAPHLVHPGSVVGVSHECTVPRFFWLPGRRQSSVRATVVRACGIG